MVFMHGQHWLTEQQTDYRTCVSAGKGLKLLLHHDARVLPPKLELSSLMSLNGEGDGLYLQQADVVS